MFRWSCFTNLSSLTCILLTLTGFGIDWTVEKCNKYLIGWEAALPTLGAAAGGALLLLRCHAIVGQIYKCKVYMLPLLI